MSAKISERGMEILDALVRLRAPSEWGDVWDRVGWGGSPFDMMNFDRSCSALMRRGLIVMDDDNLVTVTDDGRALVELARREAARRGAET